MDTTLTLRQRKALKCIARTNLAKQFYFTGGTALAHVYLHHRKSEDLDFFNEQEFDPQQVTSTLKTFQRALGFISFDYQQSFNRNIYMLRFDQSKFLKLEFTFFPFHQIEKPSEKEGLLVDSILDIATNKLFTIAQNPRGRDYFDLYCIVQKYHYTVESLRMFAKQKFDWHVDPLQLGSRFHEVAQHLDDPILVTYVEHALVVKFFQDEAMKFTSQIIG
ncbi:MAG TPA: hypothetical protein DCX25_03335 [Candidatus Pacebacteria bacterium]|nr:MAG: hypothetical protein UX00_C0001G0036 [Microgenomates group bacterium GW2011_GWB1_45_17]KKU24228.1 MAG: hypothetical protein UX36_C0002G0211 [Microgenomates group bacterium GW2011_GWC1_46_15]KKU24944.1 MAG: hypothetical protein UX35_C0001G0126 [Microgenomates group bacterium GW2011_GWA1_46_15]HAV15338.1 hypothetical protein [Candidatus Paceibacterota bacterium]HCR11390.1 hypothetical protein [Candidatus Paceibacterota bacterium]